MGIETQDNATVVNDHRGPVVTPTSTGFETRPNLRRAELAADRERERLQADQVAVLAQLGSNAADPAPCAMTIGCTVVPASPHRGPWR
jgi:hypothetical protein